ncbi:MAG: bifunctional precorrin-2 dehydrogenase/sirohydrochlorin ferrochelatase [Treponema sp.]|nr:bifunctional precorrin-2 dehydrogenase/sirohydrochlorin ferrochelatase [Treponema sp.]
MSYFPLFIDLTGKRCVVVGGGAAAARKAKTLLDFGAAITVLDPSASDEIRALSPPIALREYAYTGAAELSGAALVIAATDKPEVNRQVGEDAKKQNIPVNVVDDPELCTFYFPGIVRRGELVGGISTSGGCPRLTARLREQLETLWSPALGETLKVLKTERRRLRAAGADTGEIIQRLDLMIARLVDSRQ